MRRRDPGSWKASIAALSCLICLLPVAEAGARAKSSKLPGFKAPRSYAVGPAPAALAHADFDGDGRLDVAITDRKGVTLLRGGRRGKLTRAGTVPVGRGTGRIQAVALPGDADPDLLVALGGSLLTLRGGPGASFSVTNTIPLAGRRLAALCVADFNGDGLSDVAVSRPGERDIAVLAGLADGGFSEPTSLPSPGSPVWFGAVVAAPLNGDALPDLIATRNDGSLSTWITSPALTFGAPIPTFVGSELTDLVPGDFDGDGSIDVAAARSLSSEDQVFVLEGNGQGALRPQTPRKVGRRPGVIGSVAAADFDGDGRDDLLAGFQRAGKVALLAARSGGRLGRPAFGSVPGAGTPAVAAARADPDARFDVLALGRPKRGDGTLSVMRRK